MILPFTSKFVFILGIQYKPYEIKINPITKNFKFY